jgi:hypothetical protein
MKLAIVVQRYGADISGGAELHARYIAEHLSSKTDVRVLTTCARDHVTWRNEFPAGLDEVHGIPVERFRVSRERNLADLSEAPLDPGRARVARERRSAQPRLGDAPTTQSR